MSWWKGLLKSKKKRVPHICDTCVYYMIRFDGPDYECALRIGRPLTTCKKHTWKKWPEIDSVNKE